MAKFAQNPGEVGGGRVGTPENSSPDLPRHRAIHWYDLSVVNLSESGGLFPNPVLCLDLQVVPMRPPIFASDLKVRMLG